MATKACVTTGCVLAVALVALACVLYLRKASAGHKEHFVAEDGQYEAKLHVMKVFDLALSRKPTLEEIAKYSALGNEQDILLAVLADNKVKEGLAMEGGSGKQSLLGDSKAQKMVDAVAVDDEHTTNTKQDNVVTVKEEYVGSESSSGSSSARQLVAAGLTTATATAPAVQSQLSSSQSQSQSQMVSINKVQLERAINDMSTQLDELKKLAQMQQSSKPAAVTVR